MKTTFFFSVFDVFHKEEKNMDEANIESFSVLYDEKHDGS